MNINTKTKGFALTDVIFLLLILSLITVVTLSVMHYENGEKNEKLLENHILSDESTYDKLTRIGLSTSSDSFDGISLENNNGLIEIEGLNSSNCLDIVSFLKKKGQISGDCSNNSNVIQFALNNSRLDLVNSKNLNAVADTSSMVNPSINNLNNKAILSVNLADMLVGNISGNSVNGSGSSYNSNNSLTGGTSGSISSGGIISLPTSSTTNPSQGTSSMACSYWLSQPQYQKSSLGTRLTPCDTDYQSTSDQTGERTWSCNSLTSSNLPYSTDTWTGGSCGIICSTQLGNYPTKTQNVSCPTNYTGNIAQEQTAYCLNTIGYPTYTGWNTTSNTCVQTCSSQLGGYPTQTQTISCNNGYYGSQTQQRTSYCPNYTGSPTYGNWNTISSSCNLDCSAPSGYSTQEYQWINVNLGCPSGYSGENTYQEQQVRTKNVSYSCPSVSSSPVESDNYSGWSNDGNTQNSVNTCKLPTPIVSFNASFLYVLVPTTSGCGLVDKLYLDIDNIVESDNLTSYSYAVNGHTYTSWSNSQFYNSTKTYGGVQESNNRYYVSEPGYLQEFPCQYGSGQTCDISVTYTYNDGTTATGHVYLSEPQDTSTGYQNTCGGGAINKR